MSEFTAVVYWYLIVLAAGVIGFRCLLRIGLTQRDAWAGGRACGLVIVAYVPWWLGWAGVESWQLVAEVIFVCALVLAIFDAIRNRPVWCTAALLSEIVFLIGFTAVLLIRLDRPEILHTEKFMDLGVLTSLLRAPGFPPPDFWLAGETLPYYYWGALLWVVPLQLSGIETGVGYNLIVATLGGVIAVMAWSIGCRLSGRSTGGVIAAFLCVAAGTADGFRQLAATHNLAAIEAWQSSRQDVNVITEFPLFTLWLGDLHPHLLSIPLVLAALLLAVYSMRNGLAPSGLLILVIFSGSVAAANPWAFLPTLATVTLLVLFGEQRLLPGKKRWLDKAAILLLLACGSCIAALPFLINYTAPVQGLGWVHRGTSFPALLLYAGVLLVPMSGYVLSRMNMRRSSTRTRQLIMLSVAALLLMVASASGRPTLVLTGAMLAALIYAVLNQAPGHIRPVLILATMGVFLFFVPEVVYVRDGYEGGFSRLNTVFKSYIQAWVLLSLALPALLAQWLPDALKRRSVIAVMVLVSIAHPAALVARFDFAHVGLDGLGWMHVEDRAVVEYLGTLNGRTIVLEATGEAYGDSGRIAVASGIPTYLGWANHELVWRGVSIAPELNRRQAVVENVYRQTDPSAAAALVREEGIDLVVIGPHERRLYPAPALQAIERAGRTVFEHGESRVIRFP